MFKVLQRLSGSHQWAGLQINQSSQSSRNATAVRSFHKDYDASREEQSFELKDGRKMGFAEYGKFGGTPAFFLHGSPGSRYDGMGLIDAAKKFNIHVICPDRPGHGLSTFKPDRKISEYPNDISELAKHLQIPKYHVFGQSGGGPYAVACAYGSPSSELLNTTVIAGMGPPEVLTIQNAGLYTTLVTKLINWMPNFSRRTLDWSIATEPRIEAQLKIFYKYFIPKAEQAEFEKPEIRKIVRTAMMEAYKQGTAGVLHDSKIYSSPWDFALKDVTRKITLIYGHKDNRTPVAFGRYYKEHLPNSELIEFDDVGHFSMDKHDDVVMKKVIGE